MKRNIDHEEGKGQGRQPKIV